MAMERTLSIIKPDATRRNLTGKINARFEERGLRIVAQKRMQLDPRAGRAVLCRARARGRSSTSLVAFMTSGPVVVQVLEGENAVALNREIMGATDPANAAPGTIRKDFAGIDRGQFGARLGFAAETAAPRSPSSFPAYEAFSGEVCSGSP